MKKGHKGNKRILVITQLYPSGSTGTSVKTRNTLEYLTTKGFEFDVCCVHYKKMIHVPIGNPKITVYSVEKDTLSKFSFSYLRRAWKLLFSLRPFRVIKLYDTKLASTITMLKQKYVYKYVFFDGFSTLQYAREYNNNHIYIDDEDIIDLMWRRMNSTPNILLKLFFLIEWFKCIWYERTYLKGVSQVWAICPNSERRLEKVTRAPVFLMPTIVPLQKNVFRKKSGHIVFSGLLSWMENTHGLQWFLDTHWSKIHRQFPQTKLFITGQMASPEFIAYLEKFPNVVYKGFIEHLDTIYKQCLIAIAPIRINSGIKVKILTYLSFGLPVVSTNVATWGLSSLEGVVAVSDEKFGDAIIQLLSNKKKLVSLSNAGRRNLLSNHSWKALNRFMKSIGAFK